MAAESLDMGIERNLLGLLELCVRPWGKEMPHPDLSSPPDVTCPHPCSGPLECLLLLILGEVSERGLSQSIPAYLPALLAQMGLLSLQHPGRLQERDSAKVARISEGGTYSLCICMCVHSQGHSWGMW